MNIVYTNTSGIARITINNPQQHNVLDKQTINQFCDYIDAINNDSSAKVLIITGEGDSTFCAGANLDEIKTGTLTAKEFSRLPTSIAAITIPSICALNGDVYGGGCEIALCCDFRIGLSNMALRVPAAKLGVHYPPKGVLRYQQVLGINVAKRMLLLTESFNGDDLFANGYLTHISTSEQLQTDAVVMAEQLLALDEGALIAIKSAFTFPC